MIDILMTLCNKQGFQHNRDEAAIIKAREDTLRVAKLWDLRDAMRAPSCCASFHHLWQRHYPEAVLDF